MTERSSLPLRALPSGRAELHVVLDLDWADIAALGAEAGRLADRLQRAVTLDEAVSHRLSTGSGTRAAAPLPAPGPASATPAAAVPATERDRPRGAAPASAGSPGAEAGRHAAGRTGGSAAAAPVSAVTPMSGTSAERDRGAAPAGQRPAEERRAVERISLAASPGNTGPSGTAAPEPYRANGAAG